MAAAVEWAEHWASGFFHQQVTGLGRAAAATGDGGELAGSGLCWDSATSGVVGDGAAMGLLLFVGGSSAA